VEEVDVGAEEDNDDENEDEEEGDVVQHEQNSPRTLR
jgi:hypothetical protein